MGNFNKKSKQEQELDNKLYSTNKFTQSKSFLERSGFNIEFTPQMKGKKLSSISAIIVSFLC